MARLAGRSSDVAAKAVLVTGAACGIGAATARLLAERGARVALLDLDGPRVEATAAAIGSRAHGWRCDVTVPRDLEMATAAVVERLGAIDVVVANAGMLAVGSVADGDAATLERAIEVNLLGCLRTIRATLPQLRETRGYLLAVSSSAAALHLPLMSTYSASKAGVEALADAVRLEVAPSGVDVGVAYFGHVDTEMARQGAQDPMVKALLHLGPGFASSAVTPEHVARELVRGIQRRSRRVCVPRWLHPLVLMPGLLEPLFLPLLRRALASPVGGAATGDQAH